MKIPKKYVLFYVLFYVFDSTDLFYRYNGSIITPFVEEEVKDNTIQTRHLKETDHIVSDISNHIIDNICIGDEIKQTQKKKVVHL